MQYRAHNIYTFFQYISRQSKGPASKAEDVFQSNDPSIQHSLRQENGDHFAITQRSRECREEVHKLPHRNLWSRSFSQSRTTSA